MATPEIAIVPATEQHAWQLAPDVRGEDADEVAASGGFTALEAITKGISLSPEPRAVLFDGKVGAIYGVAPISERVGCVWCITSHWAPRRYPRQFLRLSRAVLELLLHRWKVLVQYVDARYRRAVRWVHAIGFDVGLPEPFGVEGRPFHPIRIEASHV